jgi:competence protein ComEC
VLPLSGGSAVFFDAPGRAEDLLVDCGKDNPAERVTIPFLHAQGINRLERLVLTHGDLEYVGAAELVEKTFGVKQVITSPINFRSLPYRQIVEGLERDAGKWRQAVRGESVGAWKILHPVAADNFTQADDAALVLAGTFQGVRVLLLSDLGRPGQEALQSREKDLRADIVVTGLPDQTEPVGDGFLEAVKPKVIVVADSEFPATRRAGEKLRERLERHGIPVIYTRKAGAVTVTVRGGSWAVRAMDGTNLKSE